MRICIVYDCLYPWTVGGAERWYRNLAERLSSAGHEITYLTRRQWDTARNRNCRRAVVAVSARRDLYTRRGRRRSFRRLSSALACSSTLLAMAATTTSSTQRRFRTSAAGRRSSPIRRGYRLVVDWHEVWTRGYWDAYLGAIGGLVGWATQRAGLRVRQQAFCFSRLHERRLRASGVSNVSGSRASSPERSRSRPPSRPNPASSSRAATSPRRA